MPGDVRCAFPRLAALPLFAPSRIRPSITALLQPQQAVARPLAAHRAAARKAAKLKPFPAPGLAKAWPDQTSPAPDRVHGSRVAAPPETADRSCSLGRYATVRQGPDGAGRGPPGTRIYILISLHCCPQGPPPWRPRALARRGYCSISLNERPPTPPPFCPGGPPPGTRRIIQAVSNSPPPPSPPGPRSAFSNLKFR